MNTLLLLADGFYTTKLYKQTFFQRSAIFRQKSAVLRFYPPPIWGA